MTKDRDYSYILVFLIIISVLALCYGFWVKTKEQGQSGKTVSGKPILSKPRGKRNISYVLSVLGERVKQQLSEDFERVNVKYPPKGIKLLAFKHERILEVWVAQNHSDWKLLKTYPIKATSGKLGPKLKEGDMQVPEGFYEIEGLNPNSRYHLSLKLNYPNNFDRHKSRMEKRTHPGSDIFIHGGAVSAGCLAMGDDAIEELFVLIAKTGRKNVEVIISPYDFRKPPKPTPKLPTTPTWIIQLYEEIREALARYR